ncbi:hypothetical protein BJ742DRAFT_778051 [Cladochytrium replicatum]|nr:hypothetical protein BJ742DRAFT_778051 [Cladochytrium replicatum]
MSDPPDDSIVGYTPEQFESGINLICYLAFVTIPLNMIGNLYVFTRVLSATLRSRPRVVPQSLRLPFYIVFLDLLCSVAYGTEMTHLYIARRQYEQPYSSVFGGIINFVIVSNFILISNAAFYSWTRVVRKLPTDHGPYDVKLVGPAIVVPIIVNIVFAVTGSFGQNNYICWLRKSAYPAAIFTVACIVLSTVALWYFYISIMVEVFKVSRGAFLNTIVSYRPTKPPQVSDLDQPNSNNARSGGSTQLSLRERQIIAKICMYCLACIIQYMPGIPFATSFLFPYQPYVLYVMAVVSINLGGVINATALILNEGLGKIAASNNEETTGIRDPSAEGNSGGNRGLRSDTTAGSNSWQVPSFNGVIANPQLSQKESNGSYALYAPRASQDRPQYHGGHQNVYSDPTLTQAADQSFNRVWDVSPGPSPFLTGTQTSFQSNMYPPAPPAPEQQQQFQAQASRQASQSSMYSNPATVVDYNAYAEAYRSTARLQQSQPRY